MSLRTAAVAACALLLWTSLAVAFPMYWYDSLNVLGEFISGSDLCDGHPTDEVMPDLSPHGRPMLDSSIGFTFYDTKNVTYELCPGTNYTLKVSFTEGLRLALLTADTASQVAFALPAPTAGCPNRVDLGRSVGSRAANSFNTTFTLPCGAAGRSVLFKVTSADRVNFAWKQSSVTANVSTTGSCAAAAKACGLPAGSAPPPPTPSPSRRSPSPAPSPTVTSRPPAVSSPPPRSSPPLPSPQKSSTPPRSSPSIPPPVKYPSPRPAPMPSPRKSPPPVMAPPPAMSSPRPKVSPPPPVSSLCTRSTLGYQCMEKLGKVTVHWSVNASSAPADNGCTPRNPTVINATELARNGTLHMAVQAAANGYVAIAFAETFSFMIPADVVLGWYSTSGSNGGPYIDTFAPNVNDLGLQDKYPPAGSASWAYDMGVTQQSSSTTICFSRRLSDSRPSVSQDIKTDGSQTAFNWAISAYDGFIQHKWNERGSFYLDLSRGMVPQRSA